MTVKFNVPGKERKRLAQTLAAWLGCEAKYAGAPTFAYDVDYFRIDRDGNLTFDDRADSEVIERLMEHLYDEGFDFEPVAAEEAKMDEITNEPEDPAETDDFGLTVTMPRSLFTDTQLDNLKKLIEAKAALLKEALRIGSLPVIITDEEVSFPWFETGVDAEHFGAYTSLITAMCSFAKEAKRVTAKEKETTNAKYEFRCFLLRLGFIGDEYKVNRKILLENLSGSSAFKSGHKKYAPGCDPVPTPENTVEFDVEEAEERLKDPDVQKEICDILNGKDGE